MMGRTKAARWSIGCTLSIVLASTGCREDDDSDPGSDPSVGCIGAKCDDAEDPTEADELDEVAAACAARRMDAFNPNRTAFTRDALRWSCADVPGRHPSERGQEYCEYFAIVQVPYVDQPEVLGLLLGPDFDDGTTPVSLSLDADQIDALEVDPDAIVGACVFTSWNADVEAPADDTSADVLGLPFDESVFRMRLDPNTTEAAQTLVEDCLEFIPPQGDFSDPDDPLHDPFSRACHLVADLEGTHDRKSDTIICGATVRLAECGCSLPSGGDFPRGLAPADDLGFPLGGWDGPSSLPSGCRYEERVPGSQHVVLCDLTAAQVLQNAAELKAYCQETYADDVVVHVPIPAAAVTCDPDVEADPYATGCATHPWVLEP